jgi:nucleotide-binding universal stress UspA family protein
MANIEFSLSQMETRVSENSEPALHSFELKHILYATDFLESSRLALDYAVAFSHHFGATLTIAHSFELSHEAEEAEMISHQPSVSRANALSRLEAFASGIRRLGIDVRVDLRNGEPCTAILKAATENHYGLLVLGTHGIYRGLHHVALGSNAEKILLSAPCPALTVGRHVMAGIDLEPRFSDLLVVSDFTIECVNTAAYALRLGRAFGLSVDIVHMSITDKKIASEHCNAIAAKFSDLQSVDPAAVDWRWCLPQYHQERISSAEEIIRRAEAITNSLIVSSVHPASRINRHLHASFAFELSARAACPLLSLPSSEQRFL